VTTPRRGRTVFLDEGRARLVATALLRMAESLPPGGEAIARELAAISAELGHPFDLGTRTKPPAAAESDGNHDTPMTDFLRAALGAVFGD